jgi:hypothetical protein
VYLLFHSHQEDWIEALTVLFAAALLVAVAYSVWRMIRDEPPSTEADGRAFPIQPPADDHTPPEQ